MTDNEYMTLAENLLKQIETDCDRINDESESTFDLDNQRSGNMVSLKFPGGTSIVVNLQKPLHEVWLAALSGGFHFRLEGELWRSSRTNEEFFECLSRMASEQAGRPLRFGLKTL